MDDLFHLRRGYKRAKRTSKLSIRIEPEVYNLLRQKNLSPTRIFDDAIFRLRKMKKKKSKRKQSRKKYPKKRCLKNPSP